MHESLITVIVSKYEPC